MDPSVTKTVNPSDMYDQFSLPCSDFETADK
jgi:hypothetical protein